MKTFAFRCFLLLALWLSGPTAVWADEAAELWRQLMHADRCRQEGNADSAMVLLVALLPQVTGNGSHLLLAMNHALIATVHLEKGDKESALQAYSQVAAIAEANHHLQLARQPKYSYLYETMISTYGQLALLSDELGRKQQSLAYALKGMEWLGQCDNPGAYFVATSVFTEVMLKYGDSTLVSRLTNTGRTNGPAEAPVPQAKDTDSTATEIADRGTARDTAHQIALPETGSAESGTTIRGDAMNDSRAYAVLLLAVIAIVFTCYVLWQKRQRRKSEDEARRQAQRSYLDGQERERSRLAKELHDGVSNQLLAIEMRLRDEGSLSPNTIRMLSASREQVRRVSHGLLPPEFEHSTLDDVLASYAAEMNGVNGCSVSYSSEPADAHWHIVEPPVALEVYRIVQEAVSNAMNHGQATVVSIGLHLEGATDLTVIVSDNGAAIDTTATDGSTTSGGIGQRSMQQRAAALGAIFDYRHYPFGGVAKLCFRLPKNAK